jgi:hypothetical protein
MKKLWMQKSQILLGLGLILSSTVASGMNFAGFKKPSAAELAKKLSVEQFAVTQNRQSNSH